ncbi:hypothetical protein Tco_0623324 [Tanacetum coccineum]
MITIGDGEGLEHPTSLHSTVHFLPNWKIIPNTFLDVLECSSEIGRMFKSFRIIIEQRVKVNQKARILELKRRNYEDYCDDNLYAVSIKEDTLYPCPKLHSTSTKRRLIRRIQKKSIRRIRLQVMEYSGI